jgi:hypothetical protein
VKGVTEDNDDHTLYIRAYLIMANTVPTVTASPQPLQLLVPQNGDLAQVLIKHHYVLYFLLR